MRSSSGAEIQLTAAEDEELTVASGARQPGSVAAATHAASRTPPLPRSHPIVAEHVMGRRPHHTVLAQQFPSDLELWLDQQQQPAVVPSDRHQRGNQKRQ